MKEKITKINPDWMISEDKYSCPFCNKIYNKKGIATHIWRNHGDGTNHNPNIGYVNGDRTIWNKGLSKETDDRVKKTGQTLSKKMKNGEVTPSFKGKKHTKKTKQKISKKLSQNNKGGKCKWFEYKKENGKSFKLQGTWEVRFAKILDIIDENWIKIGIGDSNHLFSWEDKNNNNKHYSPDFYSPKLNKYFEVKGYWWGEDKEKMKQVINQNPDILIEMVFKKQLEEYEKLLITKW